MKHVITGVISALLMAVASSASAVTLFDSDASSFERLGNDPLSYTYGTDFKFFWGSAATIATGSLSSPSALTGCAADDFNSFTTGSIALIERGLCAFYLKVQNAVDAGAIGVIIFNDGSTGREEALTGTAAFLLDNTPTNFLIPIIGGSYALGQNLLQETNAEFRINTVAALPVPLPAGLPLLLAGLGAFGIVRRRRRG